MKFFSPKDMLYLSKSTLLVNAAIWDTFFGNIEKQNPYFHSTYFYMLFFVFEVAMQIINENIKHLTIILKNQRDHKIFIVLRRDFMINRLKNVDSL